MVKEPSDQAAPDAQAVEGLLLELERRRCEAIAADDVAALRELLAPTLVHTHTRGNRDSLDSYLEYVTGTVDILDVQRRDMRVDVYANCAVMTGHQTNTARLRGSEDQPITVEAEVIQVWVQGNGPWQQVAFQATPVGTPPPPAPR